VTVREAEKTRMRGDLIRSLGRSTVCPFRASSITPALFRLFRRRRWSDVKIWRSRWAVDQFSRSASIS
jgi:transposase